MVDSSSRLEMSLGSAFKFVNLSGNCAAAGVQAKRTIASKLHFRKLLFAMSSNPRADDEF